MAAMFSAGIIAGHAQPAGSSSMFVTLAGFVHFMVCCCHVMLSGTACIPRHGFPVFSVLYFYYYWQIFSDSYGLSVGELNFAS